MEQIGLSVDRAVHRLLAADLYNATWSLMEKVDRNENDDEQMIRMAYASRFHWGVVGEPLNFARGEWQISRAYALVGRFEPALHHAVLSLRLCNEHDLGEFDLGFAHEAMARAYALQKSNAWRDKHLDLALQSAQKVEKESDREWLIMNVDGVKSLSIPDWE